LQSDSVVIETATLVANQEGIHYLVVATFEDSIPENTQAVIIYQDLAEPSKAQELALGSMADARRLTFKSKATQTVTRQDYFQIELLLFNDDSKAKLIARRQLSLPLDVPDRVATILGITWL
jgi:hypothetical protein